MNLSLMWNVWIWNLQNWTFYWKKWAVKKLSFSQGNIVKGDDTLV